MSIIITRKKRFKIFYYYYFFIHYETNCSYRMLMNGIWHRIWWNTAIHRLIWMKGIKHYQMRTENILFWPISYRSILLAHQVTMLMLKACQNHWIELRIPCQVNTAFRVFLMIELEKWLLQTMATFSIEILFVMLRTDFGIKDSINNQYICYMKNQKQNQKQNQNQN